MRYYVQNNLVREKWEAGKAAEIYELLKEKPRSRREIGKRL